MLHALLLTYNGLVRNTYACCHKLDTEMCVILECRLTHFPHHLLMNLHFSKQRKHPNSSSEVSAESRANAFCASVCWWMMPRRRTGRQGFVFLCSLSPCAFSSQRHGSGRRVWWSPSDSSLSLGEWREKLPPASCVAGRSRGSLSSTCPCVWISWTDMGSWRQLLLMKFCASIQKLSIWLLSYLKCQCFLAYCSGKKIQIKMSSCETKNLHWNEKIHFSFLSSFLKQVSYLQASVCL